MYRHYRIFPSSEDYLRRDLHYSKTEQIPLQKRDRLLFRLHQLRIEREASATIPWQSVEEKEITRRLSSDYLPVVQQQLDTVVGKLHLHLPTSYYDYGDLFNEAYLGFRRVFKNFDPTRYQTAAQREGGLKHLGYLHLRRSVLGFVTSADGTIPVPQRLLDGIFPEESPLVPDKAHDQKELSKMIWIALATIPVDEAQIIILRKGLFGHQEHTLQEIVDKNCGLGNGPERIRQKQAHGMKLLRHPSRSNKLLPFW